MFTMEYVIIVYLLLIVIDIVLGDSSLKIALTFIGFY